MKSPRKTGCPKLASLLLLAFAAAFATSALAQEPPAAPVPKVPKDVPAQPAPKPQDTQAPANQNLTDSQTTLKFNVNYVFLPVTVKDSSGRLAVGQVLVCGGLGILRLRCRLRRNVFWHFGDGRGWGLLCQSACCKGRSECQKQERRELVKACFPWTFHVPPARLLRVRNARPPARFCRTHPYFRYPASYGCGNHPTRLRERRTLTIVWHHALAP